MDRIKNALMRIDAPLVVLIFFLLFSPPLIPEINTAIIAAGVVFLDLIIFHRKELRQTVIDSGIWKFVIIMAAFFAYTGVITVINYFTGEFVQLMHYVTWWYRYFLIVPLLMICCIYICIKCKKKGFGVYELVMHYVGAGMLQFILVALAVLIPAVKAAFVAFIYKNTGDAYLGIPWVMERRGFGFSNSFVDSFGFGMGIVAALPLFFLKKTREKIALFVPCLVLISLVNVRTGLIMVAVGCVFALPVIFKAFMESKTKIIASALASVMLLLVFVGTVYVKNPKTIYWIFEDVASVIGVTLPEESTTAPEESTTVPEESTTASEETTEQESTTEVSTTEEPSAQETTTEESYPQETTTQKEPGFWENLSANSSDYNTADVLFSERFWNMPTGIALIFGTGHSIYGAEGYPNSDVGYVNDLWTSGIVGVLVLYAAFALVFITAFRRTRDNNIRFMILFFAAAILIFQVKANAIMFNAGLATILPILFFISFNAEQKKITGEKND